jgi:XTP/dITP diphosphohydrolase
VAAVCSQHKTRAVEGVCEGVITEEPRGQRGFGYDPVFYVPEYGRTFAEMELEFKNQISHRAKAFLALKGLIQREFDSQK